MSQSNLIHKQFLYFKGEVALPLFKTLPKVLTIFLKTDEEYYWIDTCFFFLQVL